MSFCNLSGDTSVSNYLRKKNLPKNYSYEKKQQNTL